MKLLDVVSHVFTSDMILLMTEERVNLANVCPCCLWVRVNKSDNFACKLFKLKFWGVIFDYEYV
jgi:hypothetical protein